MDDVNFDDVDLDKYNIRNPNKATQTDMFNEPSDYSSATSNRSVRTARDGESNDQQRQTSISSGESMDDVRYRTRMSIAENLATMARVGGNIIYYTGQGLGQGIGMAVDVYNWWNEDGDDTVASSGQSRDDNEDVEPPIDEEMFEQTQGLLRRGASRSRSPSPQEEQPSGSGDAIRLLRRGASRSRSETPPKRNPKKK